MLSKLQDSGEGFCIVCSESINSSLTNNSLLGTLKTFHLDIDIQARCFLKAIMEHEACKKQIFGPISHKHIYIYYIFCWHKSPIFVLFHFVNSKIKMASFNIC